MMVVKYVTLNIGISMVAVDCLLDWLIGGFID